MLEMCTQASGKSNHAMAQRPKSPKFAFYSQTIHLLNSVQTIPPYKMIAGERNLNLDVLSHKSTGTVIIVVLRFIDLPMQPS